MKTHGAGGRGANVIAGAIVGFLAGAGAMYSFNRTSAPIIGRDPVPQVVATVAPTPTAAPIMKRIPEAAQPVPAVQAESPTHVAHDGAPARVAKPKIVSRLNINTATQAQLESLPDVGPSLAKAILSYREAHGAFRTIEELDSVKGIGPKLLSRISPLVTVGSELP